MTDQPLKEGVDYVIDPETGLLVFTKEYLERRGYCCGNACRNCPFRGTSKEKKN
jgi:hypothetical protein